MRGSSIDLPSHRFWLDSEADRLLAFAAPAAHPVAGFAWPDIEGRQEMNRPIQAWITARPSRCPSDVGGRKIGTGY